MSVEFHLYTADVRPITVAELSRAANSAGKKLIVLNEFRSWSDCILAGDSDVVGDDALLCLFQSDSPIPPTPASIAELALAGSAEVTQLGIEQEPDWGDDDPVELRQAYGREYVSYRRRAKAHYFVSSGAVGAQASERALKLVESIRAGLWEDPQAGTVTIDGAVPQSIAAKKSPMALVNGRCPKCRKQVPSYRTSCRNCGQVIARPDPIT